MGDIVVFGAGPVADVARVYIDRHGPDRIVGFTVDEAFKYADTFAGRPLVAWERLEERFPPDRVKLLGPLSYRRLNELRRDRYLEGKARGYAFTSFIHPGAQVYTEEIGENTFVLEQNVIQPFVKIGCGVMLWSGNHIGHHTVIGDYCFLVHVGVGSNVRIGERTFIGGYAVIEGGITLGDACFISTASYVQHDLSAESVVTAAPDPIKAYKSSRIKRHL